MAREKYTVVLKNDGRRTLENLDVINAVVATFNLPTKEVSDFADGKDCILADNISGVMAYSLQQAVEAVGGKIEILNGAKKCKNFHKNFHLDSNYIQKINKSLLNNVNEAVENFNDAFGDFNDIFENFNEAFEDFNILEMHEDDTFDFVTHCSNKKNAPSEEEHLINKFTTSKTQQNKAPQFTAPDQQKSALKFMPSTKQESAPKFAPPTKQESASKFTAPTKQESAPKFAPPTKQESASKFIPPTKQESAPKFASPTKRESAPRFTPPEQQRSTSGSLTSNNTKCCYYHPNNVAVESCNNCGRPICSSCRDASILADGKYICFDCASAIVQNDVNIAKEKREKIQKQILFAIIGAIAFAILSMIPITGDYIQNEIPFGPVLFTLFGASLSIYFPVLKKIIVWTWRFMKWKPGIATQSQLIENILFGIKCMVMIFAFIIFVMIFSLFLMASPIVASAIAIVDYRRYIMANDLVKRNEEILQHLVDRMEYIRIQSEENADFETLANDARMQNNHFAQNVRKDGYASASKTSSDEVQEMAENDRKIKRFVVNEYGEAVRVA